MTVMRIQLRRSDYEKGISYESSVGVTNMSKGSVITSESSVTTGDTNESCDYGGYKRAVEREMEIVEWTLGIGYTKRVTGVLNHHEWEWERAGRTGGAMPVHAILLEHCYAQPPPSWSVQRRSEAR